MRTGNSIGIAILIFTLVLTGNALGQGNGRLTAAKTTTGKHQTSSARYANQEVSYLKNSGNEVSIESIRKPSPRSFDKGYISPAARRQSQLLPYMEQSNLRTHRPNRALTNHQRKNNFLN